MDVVPEGASVVSRAWWKHARRDAQKIERFQVDEFSPDEDEAGTMEHISLPGLFVARLARGTSRFKMLSRLRQVPLQKENKLFQVGRAL